MILIQTCTNNSNIENVPCAKLSQSSMGPDIKRKNYHINFPIPITLLRITAFREQKLMHGSSWIEDVNPGLDSLCGVVNGNCRSLIGESVDL